MVDLLKPLQDVVSWVFHGFLRPMIRDHLSTYINAMIQLMIGTPAPSGSGGNIFATPSSGIWAGVHSGYQDMVPIAMLILVFALILLHGLGSVAPFLSSYDIHRVYRRMVLAGLGILSWWWLGSAALNASNGLAVLISPDTVDITTDMTTMMFALSAGIVLVVLALMASWAIILAVVLLYQVRNMVIYTYMVGMPILFALWAVDIGYMRPVSGMAGKMMQYFVPACFFTLPSAIILRVGVALVDPSMFSLDNAIQSVLAFVMVLSIPALALVAPKFMFDLPGSGVARKAAGTAGMAFERAEQRMYYNDVDEGSSSNASSTSSGGGSSAPGFKKQRYMRHRDFDTSRARRRIGLAKKAAVGASGYGSRARDRMGRSDGTNTRPSNIPDDPAPAGTPMLTPGAQSQKRKATRTASSSYESSSTSSTETVTETTQTPKRTTRMNDLNAGEVDDLYVPRETENRIRQGDVTNPEVVDVKSMSEYRKQIKEKALAGESPWDAVYRVGDKE